MQLIQHYTYAIIFAIYILPPAFQLSNIKQLQFQNLHMSKGQQIDPSFSAQYEFVDRKIAEALTLTSDQITHDHKLVDKSTLCINWKNLDMLISKYRDKDMMDGISLSLQMEMLVTLATESEIAMFGRDTDLIKKILPKYIVPLFQNIDNSCMENMTHAHTVIGSQVSFKLSFNKVT